MKRLFYHYHMEIDFDMPVTDHRFTLKCLPKNNRRQRIENLSYEIRPNRFISRSEDSFGNKCIYGLCEEPHRVFLIDVKGKVSCGLEGYESECKKKDADIFKYQTSHTTPGEHLEKYHEELKQRYDCSAHAATEDLTEKVLFYMNCLHSDYEYRSGSTQITTTAEEAFSQGCGVCQDYAHILISLLRIEHIPCRYVTGMMLGEGLSHAWIEYYSDGKWIALDPTNGSIIRDDHIRIAAGRDYRDCRINQGVFIGCEGRAKQEQKIFVSVEEIE